MRAQIQTHRGLHKYVTLTPLVYPSIPKISAIRLFCARLLRQLPFVNEISFSATCNGAVVPPLDEGANESLNKVILIVSLVGAAVIVVTGVGIGVLVIYRRRKRLKRLEEERLLELERKRMAAVSKYGIARSEVGQAPAGEWNPPEDSSYEISPVNHFLTSLRLG